MAIQGLAVDYVLVNGRQLSRYRKLRLLDVHPHFFAAPAGIANLLANCPAQKRPKNPGLTAFLLQARIRVYELHAIP